jgi:hypothetical protein
MNAARPLPVDMCDPFLHAVALRLQGQEIGPGIVANTRRELQREFFAPPDLSGGNDKSRWRR